ncbi:hypothetical protein QAD02_012352 [Eretmocerus hayati]|uniref:Uncharacterized protein n=1 Tax=Eretmocerus hayati TaxID=131215 RepID=A0ACC2NZF6_9HYME|nr:hypothetical protein QAD02_012352 [Eretmocerus hayati]
MMFGQKIQNHRDHDFRKESIMYLPTFPEPIDGEISTEEFLMASQQMVKLLDRFGKIFMPVKYDLQGNIDKLKRTFNKYRHSTLQKMINEEQNHKGNMVATDALMWLRRGLRMIQLFFEYLVNDLRNNQGSDDLMPNLKKSYELSLEPYHGYLAQQLFGLLSRMIPTRPQILNAIANGYDIKHEILVESINTFTKRLKENVVILESFYDKHDLENSRRV